ncbi:MAG: insulinase family protein [Chthonomonas sp.]|nr:insulinase family protein [Chthonomonas sp.]
MRGNQGEQDEPGPAIHIKRIPDAKYVSVQLFLVANGIPAGFDRCGARHMHEHLLAVGTDGKLDLELEAAGLSLTANTLREATRFEIFGPSDQWQLAIKRIAALLAPRQWSDADIAAERKTLSEERALLGPDSFALDAAWRAINPDSVDPFGTPEGWNLLTASHINLLHRALTQSQRIVITVCGDVDVQACASFLDAEIKLAPGNSEWGLPELNLPTPQNGNKNFIAMAQGKWGTADAAARLSAARALVSASRQCSLRYTVSANGGIIACLAPDQSALKSALEIVESDPDGWAAVGIASAKSWINRSLKAPSAYGYLSGLLLCGNRLADAQIMVSALAKIDAVTVSNLLQRAAEMGPGGTLK